MHGLSCLPQAPLLAHEYRKRGLHRPRTMLTIHNIAFQVGKQQGACLEAAPGFSSQQFPQHSIWKPGYVFEGLGFRFVCSDM